MDLEKVKKSLEAAAEEIAPTQTLESLPSKFYDAFILQGLRIDRVEPGRLLCSLTVPPRLLNAGSFLHGGATASLVDLVGSAAFYTAGAQTKGSPLEINVAYLDAAFANEDIEIEAKVLRAGRSVGVATVELRKKNGKIIAQARYTKYLAPMDLNTVREWLEGEGDCAKEKAAIQNLAAEASPFKFFNVFTCKGITIDHIEHGRLLCSLKVPPRLTNERKFMHSGAVATLVYLVGSVVIISTGSPTSGVSVDISISYMDAASADDEIEIEAKVLRMEKKVAVTMVELREKKTGKVVAQGRHSKYFAPSSKL